MKAPVITGAFYLVFVSMQRHESLTDTICGT